MSRHSVERARVQVVVAQPRRHPAGQRALARGRGAIDADHWNLLGVGGGHRKKSLEIVRESLGHASGVFDAHRHPVGVESRQGKAHRHPVVVVGVDAGALPLARRQGVDLDPVRAFLHRSTEFAAFIGHGRDAVGFLHAPAGDVAQRGGAVGVQGHHRQCHGRIRNVVAIEADPLERPGSALDFEPVGTAGDLRPHQLRRFDESDVTLDRVGSHALDADAMALSDGTQRDEIAGR